VSPSYDFRKPCTSLIKKPIGLRRFDGWQTSSVGERDVRRGLRKVLWTKYQLIDEDLFNRAYEHNKEYY
jgi:type I restriction enzyme R subunit